MEINMKTIYKGFKEDIQNYIKEIAEKHGINPIQAFDRICEAVSDCLDDKVQNIAVQLNEDFEIGTKTTYEFFEGFKSEVFDLICPDWNSTIKSDSFNTYLNRRLMEEGYSTVPFETLDFLFEEFQGVKNGKEVKSDV